MLVFSHILLDFDGVVADTESVFDVFDCGVINEVLEKAGLKPDLSPEIMRRYAGLPAEDKLEVIASEKGFDAASHMERFIEKRNAERPVIFRKHKVSLARGFEAFIEKHGSRCALVTNKSRDKLEWDLGEMGMAGLFPVTACLEPPLRRKPAPDLLFRAMDQLAGAKAETSAYVGDNALDMEAALAAGVFPIGFIIEGAGQRPQQAGILRDAGAKIIVDNFDELSSYLA